MNVVNLRVLSERWRNSYKKKRKVPEIHLLFVTPLITAKTVLIIGVGIPVFLFSAGTTEGRPGFVN